MNEPFNGLTPAQVERLAFLAEEMGEALHAIGKVLRHGYGSYDPTLPSELQISNRAMLEQECGDVRAAMLMLCGACDLSKDAIHRRADEKVATVWRWMHEQ